MAGVWEGQTVVATEPLGAELAAALLAAGARAVIARRADVPAPGADQSVAFFEALYDHLLAGRTILEVRRMRGKLWGLGMSAGPVLVEFSILSADRVEPDHCTRTICLR